MTSLGTLLVKHGWITKQQLGLAISMQREIGGRLGTCLLEMGAISEDLLNRSLAEQQDVPAASAEDLQDIPEKVFRLVPAPIAIRYRAVPFRSTHGEVDIAMLEVDNLWLQDELSFIVGRRLCVHIANEARIVEALFKYYRAPCSDRFVKILKQLNRQLHERETAEPHPESRLVAASSTEAAEIRGSERASSPIDFHQAVAESAAPPPDVKPAQETAAERPRTIPLSQEELESLGASPAVTGSAQRPTAPAEIYSRDLDPGRLPQPDRAETTLSTASGPDEVGRVLLAALAQEFNRVLLFKVNSKGVKGWLAQSRGLDEERFADFQVAFDEPSIFLNLREGGSFFLGLLPEMSAHRELAACCRKDLSDECAVFPVRVRERLVALIYGDRGPLGLSDIDLDAIRDLAAAAGQAFERYLVEQKKRHQTRVPTE